MVDTGPPYPPLPGAGSNAIGKFEIGVSQIGDIAPVDWRATILSQYANSPIITALIENFDGYVDQTKNIAAFFDCVMNLVTAYGYGLDVWGRIVGVNRVLTLTEPPTWFGFAQGLPDSETFGFGPFYSGVMLTSNYSLAEESYRTLIFAKAAANITNGSIPAINQILLSLFPHRGNCYIREGSNVSGTWFGFAGTNCQPFGQAQFYDGSVSIPTMTMSYVFDFDLSPVEAAIVTQSGVLPKPTGVSATVNIL